MCLSGCSSIMKYARIIRLAPFERLKVTDSGNFHKQLQGNVGKNGHRNAQQWR